MALRAVASSSGGGGGNPPLNHVFALSELRDAYGQALTIVDALNGGAFALTPATPSIQSVLGFFTTGVTSTNIVTAELGLPSFWVGGAATLSFTAWWEADGGAPTVTEAKFSISIEAFLAADNSSQTVLAPTDITVDDTAQAYTQAVDLSTVPANSRLAIELTGTLTETGGVDIALLRLGAVSLAAA